MGDARKASFLLLLSLLPLSSRGALKNPFDPELLEGRRLKCYERVADGGGGVLAAVFVDWRVPAVTCRPNVTLCRISATCEELERCFFCPFPLKMRLESPVRTRQRAKVAPLFASSIMANLFSPLFCSRQRPRGALRGLRAGMPRGKVSCGGLQNAEIHRRDRCQVRAGPGQRIDENSSPSFSGSAFAWAICATAPLPRERGSLHYSSFGVLSLCFSPNRH